MANGKTIGKSGNEWNSGKPAAPGQSKGHSAVPSQSHSHSHSHGHSHHGHSHSHSHSNFQEANRAFKIAIAINIAIVVIEVVYGFLAHSVSLISDAGHNLTDVLGLLLAWGANTLAARPPTRHRTYGYRRTTILASLINAIVLLAVTGAVLTEAVTRLLDPVVVAGSTVAVVAAIGLVMNGGSALLFRRGSSHDLNLRGAYLHLASDALVSLAVIVAGIVIYYTGANWVDPLLSIVVSIVIAVGTWGLLKESFNLASDAVPKFIDQHEIERYLRSQPGVREIHDLHIWSMSTTDAVLTAHLVMPDYDLTSGSKPRTEIGAVDDFLFCLSSDLKTKFGIGHTTIQIETGNGTDCHLAPEHVV